MFDPANFRAPKWPESITLCNSVHPVASHVKALMLRPVRSKEEQYKDLFYVATNNDNVITYRRSDHSLQFHHLTFDEFKRRIVNKEDLASEEEVWNVDDKAKYIGNTVLEMIQAYE